jgi:DNA-binding response OmpR family regulator
MDQTNMKPKKILLVEDDDSLASVYLTRFEAEGFDVRRVPNGEEALAATIEYRPDIILLDIVMPTMDGFELLQEVKSQNLAPEAVVIILSNLGQKEDIERGLKLGADGYIIKASSTPTEVVNKVLEIAKPKAGPTGA